ncbi:MAG: phosphatase PAP2-related protein [Coriobacteriia bacterium]|nr:phosphatase PAP2-related protein [Coriobacteriia bacterium]
MDTGSHGPSRVKAWLAALSLLAAVGAATVYSNRLILTMFPDRPYPRDLLFELLPYVGWTRYLTVIALVAGFSLFLYYALRYEPRRIPAFTAVFALMYLFRAAMIVLTPLGSAQGEGAFVFDVQQFGMFPSGHMAASLILVLLTSAEHAPTLRHMQILLAMAQLAGLTLAHGHYSIDIVGGALLAYFVVHVWTEGRLFDPIKQLTGA